MEVIIFVGALGVVGVRARRFGSTARFRRAFGPPPQRQQPQLDRPLGRTSRPRHRVEVKRYIKRYFC